MTCLHHAQAAFVLLAVTLSSASFATAQKGVDPSALKREFEAGLRADTARARVRAVEALAAAQLPASLPWMLDALEATFKERAKHHHAYERLGRKIHDKTNLHVKLDRAVSRPKIAALQLAQGEARQAMEAAERVLAALREGIRTVVTGCPPEAHPSCVKAIARATVRSRKPTARAALAETLGYVPVEDARAQLITMLSDKTPEVRIAAAEALGRQKASEAVEALQAAVGDPFWQVRVSAIEALSAIGGKDAVDALIIALANVDGRLIEDVRRALAALTGQNFHDNKALWGSWWMKHRGSYTGPPVAKEKAGETDNAGDKAVTRFYGIRTRSKRLVYILDLSNSMNHRLRGGGRGTTGRRSAPIGERKVDQAITELKNSITALPNDATFNIVFYNHDVATWKKKQITATEANKRKAITWAETTVATGNTNIFDALERAFRLAGRGTFDKHYGVVADTFYLLSDGRSNRGRVTGSVQMRKEVRRLNKFRRVVIHSIALGNDADIPFMRELAKESGGQFVHVGFRGRVREP